jgi:hypothetical protein
MQLHHQNILGSSLLPLDFGHGLAANQSITSAKEWVCNKMNILLYKLHTGLLFQPKP